MPIKAPVWPELSAVEGVALAALYAFRRFRSPRPCPAGETREPRRVIPKALLITVAGVTLFYMLIQLGYSASGIGDSDTPLADLAALAIGPAGTLLLGLTAIVSVLANQLSAVTSVPRITSSLADQGMLPKWFGHISPRFATPVNSIMTVGVLGAALALTGTFVTLAIISSLSRLFAYLACIAAVPRLDFMRGETRWLQGILLPLVAGLLCIWAAAQSDLVEWQAFLAFLLAGSLLYLTARFGRRGE